VNLKAKQLEALRREREKEDDFNLDQWWLHRTYSRFEKFMAVTGAVANLMSAAFCGMMLFQAWRTNSLVLLLCGALMGCIAATDGKMNFGRLRRVFRSTE
jgi:hypothetical protein